MARALNTPRLMTALGMALVLAGWAVPADAQDQRHRVLVPAFEKVDGTRSRFGERVAQNFRRAIEQSPTHTPVPDDDIKAQLERFDLKADQMRCGIEWVQLATHVNANLVLCGTVDEQAGNRVAASFIDPEGRSAPFEVAEFQPTNERQAAEQVLAAFQQFARLLSLIRWCSEYAGSQQWESALDNCDQALELNPKHYGVHYLRGTIMSGMGRHDAALAAYRTVLELNPMNTDAMLAAGLAASANEEGDVALNYFKQYLQLNPAEESVRLQIAADAAKAGDPAAALVLVEEGITPESTGLLYQYAGHFAMNAALKSASDSGPASGENAQANEFFRKAIQHYEQAGAKDQALVDGDVLRNLLIANSKIGNAEAALGFGQRAVETTPDNADTWSAYAEALREADRTEESLAALDRIGQLNPEYSNLNARRAVLLLRLARLTDATAAIQLAQQRGELQPDQIESMSQTMSSTGFNLTKEGKFAEAEPYFDAARAVGKSELSIAMANFFHGYALIQQGDPILRGATTAAPARRAKPIFERARVLLQGAGAYADQAATRAQLLGQINDFIAVADALIAQGK